MRVTEITGIICFVLLSSLSAQEIPPIHSAYSTAMGGASISCTNHWSPLQNAAILHTTPGYWTGTSFTRGYVPEQNIYSLLAGRVTQNNAITLHYQYYGYSDYHSQLTGITYGQRLSPDISAGLTLQYALASMPALDRRTPFLGYNIAIHYQISRAFSTGIQFNTPTLGFISGNNLLTQNQGFRFSLGYQQASLIRLESHVCYQAHNNELTTHLGMDLKLHEHWRAQTGTSLNPFSPGFGFCWRQNHLQCAFSSGFHPQLGFLPSISFCYGP